MLNVDLLFRVANGKRHFTPSAKSYDIYISAFNLSQRITHTFNAAQARNKYWVIHNEYNLLPHELPNTGARLISAAAAESDFIIDVLEQIEPKLSPDTALCVDITGFMRPHLIFLMSYLKGIGLRSFDMIYAEPSQYEKKADTVFSSNVTEVRQVNGFEGAHSVDMASDILIIGSGYDHDLVSHVIAYKSSAKLIQLLSLPSLSADMYQESLIRLSRVADAPIQVPEEQLAYSSANDPFLTYLVLSDAITRIQTRQGDATNLYLSPLATKPQAVGFALFYLNHLENLPASIVFPFAEQYSKGTSRGVGRVWLYPIEL